MDNASAVASAPVVMKFGGSSVADLDRLRAVAAKVAARASERPVVVVVSAMGATTNRLIAAARELADPPAARELDMLLTTGERESMALLAVALGGLGVRAVSLTGSQSGIVTDQQHGRARVLEVRPFRIVDELAAGNVVVVGGFQGVSYRREVTTLGRGGSDTSAVALAAALGGDCEIYSDVEGVYSADPREVPEARRLATLDYREMEALARAGAKVLHAQAVQLAEERGIAIYARATAGGGETVIRGNPRRKSGVIAVASDPSVALLGLRLSGLAGREVVAAAATELGALGLRYLMVDEGGVRGVFSASQRPDLGDAIERVGAIGRSLAEALVGIAIHEGLAQVACVGSGLEERPDLVGQGLEALGQAGIHPRAVMTDAHTLAFVVEGTERAAAARSLHQRFLEPAPTP